MSNKNKHHFITSLKYNREFSTSLNHTVITTLKNHEYITALLPQQREFIKASKKFSTTQKHNEEVSTTLKHGTSTVLSFEPKQIHESVNAVLMSFHHCTNHNHEHRAGQRCFELLALIGSPQLSFQRYSQLNKHLTSRCCSHNHELNY